MTRAPSATTSGVPPSAAMEDTSCLTCSGNAPPRPRTNASTMSVAPFRTCRPLSKSRPDIRVRAVNGTNFALSSRSSRARRLYFSFASTTMERPSGVSSASEESCASSASSASGTPGAGTSFTASRLPSVIVPVLSRRRTFTSPAASTARPGEDVVLEDAVHAGDADGREETSDRRRNEADEERDEDRDGDISARVDRERAQRDRREEEDDGQAREEDVERYLVRGLLTLGPFDEADHPVEKGLSLLRGDLDDDAVGEDGRPSGDGRAVAARLAD